VFLCQKIKLQKTNNKQISMTKKTNNKQLALDLIWGLVFIWNLELVVWNLFEI
jgi:hypothetical protein